MEPESEVGNSVPSFKEELGKRLRGLEKRFKNRASAAAAAGVAKSTFQSWVEGKSDPSFGGLSKFAAATGVSLDWLATGRGPMQSSDAVSEAVAVSSSPAEPDMIELPHMPGKRIPLDWYLSGMICDGISKVYKELGMKLQPADLGKMMAEIQHELSTTYDSHEERVIALKVVLKRLKRDLTSAPDAQGSKRMA